MTPKQILGLAVVAAATLGAAIAGGLWLTAGESPVSGFERDEKPLAPGLAENPDAASRIVIRPQGHRGTLQFVQAQGRWRAPDMDGHPVDQSKPRALLRRLAHARLVYVATSPEAAAESGVTGSSPEEKSARIAIFDSHDRKLFDASVGSSISVAGTNDERLQFVRLAGERQVRIASQTVEPPSQSLDWTAQPLYDIDRTKVAAFRIEENGHKPLKVRRRPNGRLMVDKGIDTPSDSRGRAMLEVLAGALERLSFQNALRREKVVSRDRRTGKAWFQLVDGRELAFAFYRYNKALWTVIEHADGADGRASARDEHWAYLIDPVATKRLQPDLKELSEAADDSSSR